MKKVIILVFLFGFLCMVGERWYPNRFSAFNWKDGKTIYQKHFVVGEFIENPYDIQSAGKCEERFLIPQNDSEMMTPEEAARRNGEISD